ncbi:MAG: ABC transporter permease [Chloroflexi bacterium]|nr:MAG: ABC transporter permease [Chloroflexota bacterium]
MSDVADERLLEVGGELRRRNPLAGFAVRLIREKPLGVAGGVIVLLMLFTAIFANFLAPYPYAEIHMGEALLPPGVKYILGTDHLGRCLLSRIIYGARISLYVGLGATFINVIVAALVGIPCGLIGGKFDLLVQRIVDALIVFPPLLFLVSVMSLVGVGLIQVIVVLGISGGFSLSRLVRSATIAIRENVYFEAARAIGSTTPHILLRHALPNLMPVLIIAFSIGVAGNILTEASLSFLGVGIPPPYPSWGGMISWEGRRYMYEAPHLAIWPGLALSICVYGLNIFGDAVRDLVDPRLRGGVGRYGGQTHIS